MAIESLFGPSLANIQELRQREAEKEILGAGQQFGVFAPLYQAGLRFGNQAVQGINTLMGVQDPLLKKATDMQSILGEYADKDLTDPKVLKDISGKLRQRGYVNESFQIASEANKLAVQQEELGIKREDLATRRANAARDLRREQRDILKFVTDNPEAVGTEIQSLNASIATKLQAAGIDPNQPIQDPVLAQQVAQAVQSLPETQRLNELTQAASRGAMKLDMDLNKPDSMPKLGFASDDGQAVYRQGTEQFKLGPSGQRIPYYGSFRKEGADITINSPKERFAVIGQFDTAVKPITDSMRALNKALVLNSRTGSSFSGAAFKQEVGALFGDAVKAAKEIEAIANTGALDERIAGRMSSFLLGQSTTIQKEDRDATLKALRAYFKEEYEMRAGQYRTALGNTPADKEEADRLFPSFEKKYPQSKGLEPKPPAAPKKIPLTPAQKNNPSFVEGAEFDYPDGSWYKVINGELVKQN